MGEGLLREIGICWWEPATLGDALLDVSVSPDNLARPRKELPRARPAYIASAQ